MATMDEHLAQLLANTQLPQAAPRKQAENDLANLRRTPEFPLSLSRIGSHTAVPVEIRQSALTYLRKFVEENWSPEGSDGPHIPIPDPTKDQLRQAILELVLSNEDERKVKVAASYVVSKIAMVDFPSQWPALLPSVLATMPAGTDAQLHGALRILQDLVEESLSDEQFFTVARDIINACYEVAINANRKQTHRALAVLVFRSCFDLMDTVKDSSHQSEVVAFAQEVSQMWLPFLEESIKSLLPDLATLGAGPEIWYGPVALKVQVVKTLAKIKNFHEGIIDHRIAELFSTVWGELSRLQTAYRELFIDADAQGRLEDIDGLPFTLDFLVLEELDFLNTCLKTIPVQKELRAQLTAHGSIQNTPWIADFITILASYAQITQEEEGLWDIDVSLYLAEETSVSSSYTARTACGDVAIKMGELEWLTTGSLEALYAHTQELFPQEGGGNWRLQEAVLFLFTVMIRDFADTQVAIPEQICKSYVKLAQYAVSRVDEPLLQARGFIVAGALAFHYRPALSLYDKTVAAVTSDVPELVQVSCIKSIQGLIEGGLTEDKQSQVVMAIQRFLEGKDLTDLEDADDLLVTLLETLRDAVMMNPQNVVHTTSNAIELVFLIAKHGAANFQVTEITRDLFNDVSAATADNITLYTALCGKVVPILSGTFDVANMTQDDPLVTLASDILADITKDGPEPLPAGLVASVLPKLSRLLMEAVEGDVLRPCAEALKNMLKHDYQQVLEWHDDSGHYGLDVCLLIIDRLLGPSVEDNAASEVGGLAAELVEKAGQERLGTYLPQLLRAVAVRLDTAQEVPLIQNLTLVFARLSLFGAQDVVNFLGDLDINGQNGLQVVLTKWLEQSVNFAGYDEIRQNVIALSKVYALNDPRIAQIQVKGDLIVPESNMIMTRSRARKNPDQWTIVPATLKVLKVLVTELASASTERSAPHLASAKLAAEAVDDDGDEGWEDEPDTRKLTTAELMSYAEEFGSGSGPERYPDDETQRYLSEFFVGVARENLGGFQDWYNMLTGDEQGKLQELAQQ